MTGKLSGDLVFKVVSQLHKRVNLEEYAEAAVQALEQNQSDESLRLIGTRKITQSYLVICEGKEFSVSGSLNFKSKYKTEVLNANEVVVNGKLVFVRVVHPTSNSQAKLEAGDRILRANLSGKVVSIKCKLGEKVVSGQVLVVIESMKMEHSLKSRVDGVIGSIYVTEGQSVQAKAELVKIDA